MIFFGRCDQCIGNVTLFCDLLVLYNIGGICRPSTLREKKKDKAWGVVLSGHRRREVLSSNATNRVGWTRRFSETEGPRKNDATITEWRDRGGEPKETRAAHSKTRPCSTAVIVRHDSAVAVHIHSRKWTLTRFWCGKGCVLFQLLQQGTCLLYARPPTLD